MDKVCVVGLGYVGLPTALILAERGYRVVGYDVDQTKVAQVNLGAVSVNECGLAERLTEVLNAGNFFATTTPTEAEYFIIAVPTPLSSRQGADLSYVFNATNAIIPRLKKGDAVIVESTVPVGTTDLVAQMIEQKSGMVVGQDFFVAHAPERVLPGKAFQEIVFNDRIIGGVTDMCSIHVAHFYKTFVKGSIVVRSARFAEFIKLVENSSADVHIAFAHEVACMAEHFGFDPYEVIAIANRHPRVKILTPTCGVGGHCIPIDPWFLINQAPEQTALMQAARLVNERRPHAIVNHIKRAVRDWCIRNERNVCHVHALGVTYKPDVDDTRESPALEVVQELRKDPSVRLFVSEPHISSERLKQLVGDCACDYTEGILHADIAVLLVGHAMWENFALTQGCEVLDFSGLTLKRYGRSSSSDTFNFDGIYKKEPSERALL